MNNVIVLGNGKSRLAHVDMINNFDGLVCGCNEVYKELIDGPLKRLDCLTSDNQLIQQHAIDLKAKHGFTYQIYDFYRFQKPLPEAKVCNIPDRYLNNSGLHWLVYWLTEGKADKIYIAGMDFGGFDLHNPGQEYRDKSHWVTKFREVIKEYGHWKIEFIGKDHIPYLLSSDPDDKYARLYLNGKDHLVPDYLNLTQEELLARYPLGSMEHPRVFRMQDVKHYYRLDGTVEEINN